MNYGYNNNNPYGVNPYANNPYGGYAPMSPPTPTIKPNTLQYATEEEIRAYILQPNSQVLAMDREKPLFYIKSTDELGRSSFTVYRFEKATATEQTPTATQDLSKYATKDEFKPIFERLEKLEKSLKKGGSKLDE